MSSQPTFKESEQQLEAILEKVENGSYDELDDLLQDYEAGKKLIEDMQKRLDQAKNKITKVNK